MPNWDFDSPTPRKDSSAAAIVASALFELGGLTHDPADQRRYREAASRMLDALASPAYLAEGTGSQGILLHGVGHLPAGREVDVSLIYGDYYFLEALARRPPPEDGGTPDAGTDSGAPDGGTDAGEGADAGLPDGGADAGVADGGDAGGDAGLFDGASDGGCEPGPAFDDPNGCVTEPATGCGCQTSGSALLAAAALALGSFLRGRRLTRPQARNSASPRT